MTRKKLKSTFIRQTTEPRTGALARQFAEDAHGQIYHVGRHGWVRIHRPEHTVQRTAKLDGRPLPTIPFRGHEHLCRMADQALTGLNKKARFIKGEPRDPNLLHTTEEVAAIFNISPRRILAIAADRGLAPARTAGRAKLWRHADLPLFIPRPSGAAGHERLLTAAKQQSST